MFLTLFGYRVLEGASQGTSTHHLLTQFSGLYSSKIENFETCFFAIVTTQNDHTQYVKHVLGLLYPFFTALGEWVWGKAGPLFEVPCRRQ